MAIAPARARTGADYDDLRRSGLAQVLLKGRINRLLARRRAEERYGLVLDDADLDAIEADIEAGHSDAILIRIAGTSATRTIHAVALGARRLPIVYEGSTRSIVTVLSPATLDPDLKLLRPLDGPDDEVDDDPGIRSADDDEGDGLADPGPAWPPTTSAYPTRPAPPLPPTKVALLDRTPAADRREAEDRMATEVAGIEATIGAIHARQRGVAVELARLKGPAREEELVEIMEAIAAWKVSHRRVLVATYALVVGISVIRFVLWQTFIARHPKLATGGGS